MCENKWQLALNYKESENEKKLVDDHNFGDVNYGFKPKSAKLWCP